MKQSKNTSVTQAEAIKCLLACILVFVVMSTLCACRAPASKPELPCQSPAALQQALDYALNQHDTNTFWALHAWINITPNYERLHKRIFLQFFPVQAGDQTVFKSFRIIKLTAETQVIAERTDPKKPHFNIPVEGTIVCEGKGTVAGRRINMPLEFEFGKLPDGTYRLAVLGKAE